MSFNNLKVEEQQYNLSSSSGECLDILDNKDFDFTLDIPSEISKVLKLTGSRAWEAAKETSDWDYICYPEVLEELLRWCETNEINYTRHICKGSVYIKDSENNIYNIIPLVKAEFDAWSFATLMMRFISKRNYLVKFDFGDKSKVYGLFGLFKAIHRFIC